MENIADDQVQIQIRIRETRRAFSIHKPRSYLQLVDAIKREVPKKIYGFWPPV